MPTRRSPWTTPDLARVAVMGDWTNAGRVSSDVTIKRVRSPQGMPTAWGKVPGRQLPLSPIPLVHGRDEAHLKRG